MSLKDKLLSGAPQGVHKNAFGWGVQPKIKWRAHRSQLLKDKSPCFACVSGAWPHRTRTYRKRATCLYIYLFISTNPPTYSLCPSSPHITKRRWAPTKTKQNKHVCLLGCILSLFPIVYGGHVGQMGRCHVEERESPSLSLSLSIANILISLVKSHPQYE